MKVRLLLTMECSRKCEACCNNTLSPAPVKVTMKELLNDYIAKDVTEINITGGEPAEYKSLVEFCHILKIVNPDLTSYLYSAKYNKRVMQAMAYCDGLTYTMHRNSDQWDLKALVELQHDICSYEFMKHSMRLTIDPKLNRHIELMPSVWNSIKTQPFIEDRICPIPDDELFLMLVEEEKMDETNANEAQERANNNIQHCNAA